MAPSPPCWCSGFHSPPVPSYQPVTPQPGALICSGSYQSPNKSSSDSLLLCQIDFGSTPNTEAVFCISFSSASCYVVLLSSSCPTEEDPSNEGVFCSISPQHQPPSAREMLTPPLVPPVESYIDKGH